MVRSLAPRLRVIFFRSATGREPVREWLSGLDRDSKKTLGEDIKTVQYGWPLGMPLVKGLGEGLWELRSRTFRGNARVLFLVEAATMILLHGFFKKTWRIPRKELAIARRRAATLRQGG